MGDFEASQNQDMLSLRGGGGCCFENDLADGSADAQAAWSRQASGDQRDQQQPPPPSYLQYAQGQQAKAGKPPPTYHHATTGTDERVDMFSSALSMPFESATDLANIRFMKRMNGIGEYLQSKQNIMDRLQAVRLYRKRYLHTYW